MHIVFFGSGGSALVARFLGEKNKRRANEFFSFLIYATIVAGILLSIAGWFVIPSFARILGAEGELLRHSVLYARTLCLFFLARPESGLPLQERNFSAL